MWGCHYGERAKGESLLRGIGGRVQNRRLILLPISFFLLGTAWAFASPLGSAADDDFHLANIWCARGPSQLCQTLEDEFLNEEFTVVPEVIRESTCYVYSGPTKKPEDASCLEKYDTNLVVAKRVGTSEDRLNYAPGFYPVLRVFAGQDIQFSVQIMRVFNVLLASMLFAAALWLATEPVRRAIGYSWGLLFTPIGIFFVASTNPTSWAITGIGLSWVFAWTAFTPRRSRRVKAAAATGLLVSTIIATAARLDSPAFIGIVVLGVLVARATSFRKQIVPILALGGFVVATLAAVAIGRRWGRNFSFIGAHTGTDMPAPLVKTALEIPAILFAFVGGQRPTYVMRESPEDQLMEGYRGLGLSFGHGWGENVLPSAVGLTLGCVAFFVTLIGLSRASWWRRAGVLIVTAAIPAVVLTAQASDAYRGVSIQPRYLFGLFIVAVGLAVIEGGKGPRLFSRFQLSVLGSLVWLVTTIAWLQTSSRYAIGPQATYTNFGQEPGWWWTEFPGRLASTGLVAMVTATWITLALMSSPARSPKATHPE